MEQIFCKLAQGLEGPDWDIRRVTLACSIERCDNVLVSTRQQ